MFDCAGAVGASPRRRVLVACEFTGVVRDAFRRRGHDAVSCDLEPSEAPGPHIQGDARALLRDGWDLLIAHPPCTRLANSGVRWLRERDLWADLDAGCDLFRAFLEAPIPRVAVENPLPHRYAVARVGRYTQTFQPWEFGDAMQKRVCLWLRNLPPLLPTATAQGRLADVHRLAPGPDRARERSRFFPGVADAMASQWGG